MAAMRSLSIGCLALALFAGAAQGSDVTINRFNDDVTATISANDGMGQSISDEDVVLSQFNVTYAGASFDTFCIDLFHTVEVNQTYAVQPRSDLAQAFMSGSRMAYVFQNFGTQDLSNNADQAAAVQIALWDLSLNNHNPTMFGPDGDGTYSSGDESVFSVSFGSNPDAATIAGMVNSYLVGSIDATTTGAWLDASASENPPNTGQSLLLPAGVSVPEPPSILLVVVAAVGLGARGPLRASRHRP